MDPFTVFDDEILSLEDVLELVDYEENNPEETFFSTNNNRLYREFLAWLAQADTEDTDEPDTETEE